MNDDAPTRLPVLDLETSEDDEPSCSPKIYVSNEEKAILEAMRGLRERAVVLRDALAAVGSDDERRRLEAELAELRSRRDELAVRREKAFTRKMIMLGHLPPDDEVSLF
jgi:hypothetical protein